MTTIEQLLISILEEYEAAGVNSEELEQKTLFRLLNCCLPSGGRSSAE